MPESLYGTSVSRGTAELSTCREKFLTRTHRRNGSLQSGSPSGHALNPRKLAVSAVVGTIIMVAIVVPLGFALWAFANSSVGASVEAQGQRVSSDINTIKEKFVIVNIATSGSSVTFYVYNNGVVKTSIIAIYCGTTSPTTPVPAASITSPSPFPAPLDMGRLQAFTFTVPVPAVPVPACNFSPGDTMYVKVVGEYGTAATYFQRVP